MVSCEYMTSPLNTICKLKVKCSLKGDLDQQLFKKPFGFGIALKQ